MCLKQIQWLVSEVSLPGLSPPGSLEQAFSTASPGTCTVTPPASTSATSSGSSPERWPASSSVCPSTASGAVGSSCSLLSSLGCPPCCCWPSLSVRLSSTFRIMFYLNSSQAVRDHNTEQELNHIMEVSTINILKHSKIKYIKNINMYSLCVYVYKYIFELTLQISFLFSGSGPNMESLDRYIYIYNPYPLFMLLKIQCVVHADRIN